MSGNRRLLPLALVLVALLAASAGLLARGSGDGEDRPPATATLKLIPARALVVVHLSTDRERDAVARARRLVARLPSWPRLREDVLRRLDAPGCGIDMRREPGRETALALLPGRGRRATSLILTDAPSTGVTAIPKPCGALVVRKVGDLVAIGEPESVLAAEALHEGRGRSLAASPVYRRAAAGLPESRVVDAWVSPAGARRLLTPLGGVLGTIGSLLDTPGLRGVAAALVPGDSHARITVRRIAGRRSASPPFEATLQDRAPRDALAYVASGDLTGALQRLVVLAGPRAGDALPRILAEGGKPLLTLGELGRESAIVIAPGDTGPVLTLLARMSDPPRARAAMRALEAPLARLTGAPAEALFADVRLGGAQARTLSGAAATGLSWALDGKTLIFSTAPSGIASAMQRGGRLTDSRAYRAVNGNLPNPITSLVFLDPNQLLRVGEQTGLGPADALQEIRDDLARVRAVGAHGAGAGDVSTVELSLWIP